MTCNYCGQPLRDTHARPYCSYQCRCWHNADKYRDRLELYTRLPYKEN